MITAKVILDSISPEGIRLTTLQLRYPRMVHADFMTHRVFSRNGRSSRAVPFATLVNEEPYVPEFGRNQSGMVAAETPFSDTEQAVAQQIWWRAAKACQEAAQELADVGVHKQWVNRMLEWFGYIDVLVTSTEWANFFALRDEAGAQPEIQELARAMKVAMEGSTPNKLQVGQWHLPYITEEDDKLIHAYFTESWTRQTGEHEDSMPLTPQCPEWIEIKRKVSVARCARLTIKPFDGDGSIKKELKRFELLMVSRPVHSSPAEHVATPAQYNKGPRLDYTGNGTYAKGVWFNKAEWGNYFGWRQFRKMIPHNTVY